MEVTVLTQHRAIPIAITALLIAGCTDASGPTSGSSCQNVHVPSSGAVLVPQSVSTSLCVQIPAGTDRYFLAFADVRDIERSRTAPGGSAVDHDFNFLIRGVKRQTVVRSDRIKDAELFPVELPHRTRLTVDLFCDQNPSSPTCRATPWQPGEQFQDPRGIKYSVIVIERPLVFALAETENAVLTDAARETYKSVARRLVATHLPIQEKIFGELPATSPGAGQTLILIRTGLPPQSVISNALEKPYGYIEVPGSGVRVEEYATFFLYAHELTHLGQFRWGWLVDPAGRRAAGGLGYWGLPAWGSEGGADFLACESLREEAGQSLTSNIEPPSISGESALGMYASCLRSAYGDIHGGYGSAAMYLRTIEADLVKSGVTIETARRELSQGALEGWFGIDDATLRSAGFTERVTKLLGKSFDPGILLVESAMRTALDDVDPPTEWNIPFTKKAWKFWGPNAALQATADTIPVEVFAKADGAGYLIITGDAVERTVRIDVPFAATRWMIGRQQQ
jgi:hypothetical protein